MGVNRQNAVNWLYPPSCRTSGPLKHSTCRKPRGLPYPTGDEVCSCAHRRVLGCRVSTASQASVRREPATESTAKSCRGSSPPSARRASQQRLEPCEDREGLHSPVSSFPTLLRLRVSLRRPTPPLQPLPRTTNIPLPTPRGLRKRIVWTPAELETHADAKFGDA